MNKRYACKLFLEINWWFQQIGIDSVQNAGIEWKLKTLKSESRVKLFLAIFSVLHNIKLDDCFVIMALHTLKTCVLEVRDYLHLLWLCHYILNDFQLFEVLGVPFKKILSWTVCLILVILQSTTMIDNITTKSIMCQSKPQQHIFVSFILQWLYMVKIYFFSRKGNFYKKLYCVVIELFLLNIIINDTSFL